jgi:hypothetical protein
MTQKECFIIELKFGGHLLRKKNREKEKKRELLVGLTIHNPRTKCYITSQPSIQEKNGKEKKGRRERRAPSLLNAALLHLEQYGFL